MNHEITVSTLTIFKYKVQNTRAQECVSLKGWCRHKSLPQSIFTFKLVIDSGHMTNRQSQSILPHFHEEVTMQIYKFCLFSTQLHL